jgi:hypothetical protein
MLGAGTIINPIIKVVTTVAILAAIGIFIVKPVLETTENVSNDVNTNIRNSLKASQQASQGFDLDFSESRAESFASSLQSTWPAAAREVNGCIRDARGDARAMSRCEDFAEKVVHTVQSDRSFALSYADSVAAQGDGAGAARIETCVKQAGYRPAGMQRCRDLADKLLFG